LFRTKTIYGQEVDTMAKDNGQMTNNDLLNTTKSKNQNKAKRKIDQCESHKSWLWTKVPQKGKQTFENTEGAIKKGQPTERRKSKQRHNTIWVGHHYAQTNTNNVNKTCSLLQTTRGNDEPNIGFIRIL